MKRYFFFFFMIGNTLIPLHFLFAQASHEVSLLPTSENPVVRTGFYMGIEGGANFVIYKTSEFPTLGSEPTCSPARNGAGIAPSLGITEEIPLSEAMQGFIILEGLYNSKSAKFNIINSDPRCPLLTTDYSGTLAYFDVNCGFKYNFLEGYVPKGPAIQLTMDVGLRVAGSYSLTTIDSEGRSATSGGRFSDLQSIRIGLRGQVMYDIPLSGYIGLRPVVGYDYAFSSVNIDRTWNAESAYGEITLIFLLR